ncbi:glutathione S-transferase family protein [Rhizobium sp. CECT 9324]|uniref:glutathione S-transferase family protein n=1 Tax=Rhizobium sp. CECT 9324 TaxID=2845820 RepID=UPI001E4BFA57|nr:glutathione S-transferase family protein [Rhizobium sp. CECT 9324]CAH0340042.1 Stringent starvation protein A [Rhizobium sp. CECT 9324]
MSKITLFGTDDSVYVRIARMTLHEKGVDYELMPIDIFAVDSVPASYVDRQPFGKIPSFEHDGFRLYETGAITRYIDEAFPGPRLQPEDPRRRARMNQLISIADAYIYRPLVWGLYVELVSKAASGEPPDQRWVGEAREKMPVCLGALSDFLADSLWFCGDGLTLADLYLAPMLDYFLLVPEGADAFRKIENLRTWRDRIGRRESFLATCPLTRS